MPFIVRRRRRLMNVVLLMSLLLMLPLSAQAQDSGSAFASIRHYDGIDPADQADIGRIASEGFLPIVRGAPGFIGYYLVHSGDELVAVSLFDSQEQASASNELARGFVAENMAPLLPNPPRIIEGTVNVESVANDAPDSFFASVRIYDGFDMANLDEAVAAARDGFLPLIRESAGFFGYYTMNDGEGALATVSIFASEEAALASNEIARDFVAENLAQLLPNDPLTASGNLSVAALTAMHSGKNLLASDMDMEATGAFASVRVYEGIDAADQSEIWRLVDGVFLPILQEVPGFIGYYLIQTDGDMLVAVSLFDSQEQASASNELAREFVAENLAPLLPNPPRIIEGTVNVESVADDVPDSLFASVRIYDDYNMENLNESNARVREIFLPALLETPGFFGYYTLNDGDDALVAISIFESEEAALASNDMASEFVAEHLAEFDLGTPARISGNATVVSLAAQ